MLIQGRTYQFGQRPVDMDQVRPGDIAHFIALSSEGFKPASAQVLSLTLFHRLFHKLIHSRSAEVSRIVRSGDKSGEDELMWEMHKVVARGAGAVV